MNTEFKRVVGRMKAAQATLQGMIKSQGWVEDARKYAERQGKEVRKLIAGDLGKVKTFLERERKELERFQKQIPGEVKKIRAFVTEQRRELRRLLVRVSKADAAIAKSRAKGSKSPKTAKTTSRKRKAAK